MRCICDSKRGQAWGFDLMIATIIFISGIVSFYLYSLNYQTEAQETLDTLFYEGNTISEDLLSSGYPSTWNAGNVQVIGLTDDGKINQTKLERFYGLSLEDYGRTRSILNINNNYFINFSDTLTLNIEGENIDVDGIGKTPENAKNIIMVTRLTVYHEKPAAMNVFIWN